MVFVLLHFPQCCFVLHGPNMTTCMRGRRRRGMIMATRRKVLDKRYAQKEGVCVLTQNLKESLLVASFPGSPGT